MLIRIMLAMDNTIKAIDMDRKPDIEVITMGCSLLHQLVDLHHMRFEEENIYPLFENGEYSGFISAMRSQHDEGRKFVARIEALCKSGNRGRSQLEELKNYFTDFHEMMLAHVAFEESVLFPVMEGTLSGDELEELKIRGREQEESLFGPDATQKAFDMLYQLEAAAGVKGASHFTKKAR